MGYDWCADCGGEMVSCECEEFVDEYDDYDGPDGDDSEEIDDHNVVWSVDPNGVGRIEVVW